VNDPGDPAASDENAPDGEDPSFREEVAPVKPMSKGLRRFLLGCVWLAVLMMVGPPLVSLFGIGTAVSGLDGGLREATTRPELQEKVGFAFNSTFVVALCAPAGVFLLVLAGLPLAAEKKRLADLERMRQPR
jgi:hypothetical protein